MINTMAKMKIIQFLSTPFMKIVIGRGQKHLRYYLGSFLLNTFVAISEGLSYGFILLAFSVISGDSSTLNLSLPFIQDLDYHKDLVRFNQYQLFVGLLSIAIVLQILRSIFNFFSLHLMTLLSLKIQVKAQADVYSQIFSLSFACVNKYKVGDLVDYARAPSLFIQPMMTQVQLVFVSIFMSSSMILMMFLIAPKLTYISLLLFAIVVLIQRFIIRKISSHSTQFANQLAKFSQETVQNLQAIRLIHTYHQQETFLKKITRILQKTARSSTKLHLWHNSIQPITEIMGICLVAALLLAGTFLLSFQSSLLLPTLLTFMLLTYRLSSKVQIGLSNLGIIASNFGYIFRLNNILSKDDKEFDTPHGKTFPGFKKNIKFDCVGFNYIKSEPTTLSNISFDIPIGSTIALVGSSGAGKSTIIDLIIRLYNPSTGGIFIDDINLAKYSLASWRDHIGVVSQDICIFNNSLADNITFGHPNQNKEDIIQAAKSAHAHEFIVKLPNGYQTIVGERGYSLSGGEKQRIALARALFKNPDLLILDEATSNLDSYSEHLIQDTLNQLHHHRTVIIVAHRLSTIVNADTILVLDQGTIIESGNHLELLELDRQYAHLWKLQSERKTNVGKNLFEKSTLLTNP